MTEQSKVDIANQVTELVAISLGDDFSPPSKKSSENGFGIRNTDIANFSYGVEFEDGNFEIWAQEIQTNENFLDIRPASTSSEELIIALKEIMEDIEQHVQEINEQHYSDF
jgi:hypothetical protein